MSEEKLFEEWWKKHQQETWEKQTPEAERIKKKRCPEHWGTGLKRYYREGWMARSTEPIPVDRQVRRFRYLVAPEPWMVLSGIGTVIIALADSRLSIMVGLVFSSIAVTGIMVAGWIYASDCAAESKRLRP
jgi:hypothetical protein